MIVNLLNGIFRAIEWILNSIISVFPMSPLVWEYQLPAWARWINAFIPFQEMVGLLSAYVTAVLLYYATRIIARWIKAVGS